MKPLRDESAMSDVIIVGTDTGAGKTTLALLWMAAFADYYDYWKPVETGESDTNLVERLVPFARTHPPTARYRDPVAPALAARRMGARAATAAEIVAARPQELGSGRHLLIETFGSVLSPLNDDELQAQLIARLGLPVILVGPSAVGAIGRTLQSLAALAASGMHPTVVALLGPHDDYAEEQIQRHGPLAHVFGVTVPQSFTCDGVSRCATEQSPTLEAIRCQATTIPSTNLASGGRQPPGAFDIVKHRDIGKHRGANAPRSPGWSPEQSGEGRVADSDIIERDRKAIWHPYTSLRDPDPPLVLVEAQDEYLMLAGGRRVIDGISSWWTILLGHRHPALMQALAQAASRYDHVHFAGVTHEPAVELAELLLGTMPWQGGRVFYSDDGSTAVEVALKMAYQFWCHQDEPQRTCFVGFDGGYHGDTFGAMAVGRDPVFFGGFEPLLFRAERLPVSADRLDDFLRRTGEQVAAVIIEPLVQGAGGMRMHTPQELRAIHQVTRDHNVLFIADEVMTGGGRTGELWAHRAAAIAPDLVCAGKTLAGGVLPLAATLVAPHVVAAWDTLDRSRTFFHGHSFTAHPLACSVAVANWRILATGEVKALDSPPIVARGEGNGVRGVAATIEKFWTERLATLHRLNGVKEVRICGTIVAIELDTPGGYLADTGPSLRRACMDRGVLLRPLGNVLYAMPPFCTSSSSLEQIAAAIEHAVAIQPG
jgi:adenosylmethionine-8-amino-7-oxononanoate aminotransferase